MRRVHRAENLDRYTPPALTNVPAKVCGLCDEAYTSPEISRLLDRAIEKYRAGRLEIKPIAAGEIDLKQSA